MPSLRDPQNENYWNTPGEPIVMCLSQAAYQLSGHISVMNSEIGVEGSGGIAFLGDIRNSTVPEQPDRTSNLAIL